jgi:hypothetical protein
MRSSIEDRVSLWRSLALEGILERRLDGESGLAHSDDSINQRRHRRSAQKRTPAFPPLATLVNEALGLKRR